MGMAWLMMKMASRLMEWMVWYVVHLYKGTKGWQRWEITWFKCLLLLAKRVGDFEPQTGLGKLCLLAVCLEFSGQNLC
jgi:hypothetical protein